MEDRSTSVLAYNLETVMAEKLEIVISMGDQNTRPRDYYDIYILIKEDAEDNLMRVCSKDIAAELLKMTFSAEADMQEW